MVAAVNQRKCNASFSGVGKQSPDPLMQRSIAPGLCLWGVFSTRWSCEQDPQWVKSDVLLPPGVSRAPGAAPHLCLGLNLPGP